MNEATLFKLKSNVLLMMNVDLLEVHLLMKQLCAYTIKLFLWWQLLLLCGKLAICGAPLQGKCAWPGPQILDVDKIGG